MSNERLGSGKAEADFLSGGGEMGKAIRLLDWSTTTLGAADHWSPTLRVMVRFLLANRFPLLLWWGPQYVSIYNDAYRPILGIKDPAALGRPVEEVWSEIWDVLRPLIDTPFNGGPPTWIEDLLLELNRHGFTEEAHFTVAYSAVPDELAPRGIGGVLATVHEITEKVVGGRRITLLGELGARVGEAKTAEEACTIAAQLIEHHPHDVPFAFLYLTNWKDKRATLAGAAGIALGELVGPLFKDWPEDDRIPVTGPFAEALRTQSPAVLQNLSEHLQRVPSGPWSDPPHSALIVPLRSNKAHQLEGFLVAGVSARLKLDPAYQSFFELMATQIAASIANARAYEEERRRAESLAALDRAKTEFFSNVSHEFRTPLTLLLGPMEEALSKPQEGLNGEALAGAHRNGLRLLKLVNTLLDFSRIEAGRTAARFVPTDLAAMTRELASIFSAATDRAGLALNIDCPPLPEPFYVDRDMWEKIVLNLLSNAFKYTFEGEIRVALRADQAGAELTVTDTGTGIPAEAMPSLFQRFYRVSGARGRTHEGSGIGLSLVRELVQLHGGTIEAKSRVDVGTTFTVRIPAGVAHLPSDQLAEGEDSERSLAATFVAEAERWLPDNQEAVASEGVLVLAHLESPMIQTREEIRPIILLADDSRDMREYVTRLLKPKFQIIAAQDGQQALDLLESGVLPDLVLSDVMMPRLDGLGLLKALRANPRTETIPVIFLSARAGEEARIEGLDVGADDYLIKPFSARELVTRIDTHVRLSRLRRAIDQRKDVFLATLAHELRNPLAPIRNAAQVLSSPKLEPKQLLWAQTVIQRQVKNMAWLLDDLLDVARITQGKLELKRQRVTLKSAIEAAVEVARPLLDSKNHRFLLGMPVEPVMLDADPLRLSQVVSNLLTNAAKYTDRGGNVSLTAKVQDRQVCLSIKDDGIGISGESLAGIFDMFSQVDGTAQRSEGGLGIGLALVSGLVALHGGTVEAKSEGLGRGSEFLVRLAVATSEAPPLDSTDPIASPKAHLRILIADDNKDAADSVAMLLEMEGHEVKVVHDGPAALLQARSFSPDVAILDIGMPRMNGYELAQALRGESWGQGIYLVALTGWGQESDRQKALSAGFDKHLTKPVDPATFELVLSELILERAGKA